MRALTCASEPRKDCGQHCLVDNAARSRSATGVLLLSTSPNLEFRRVRLAAELRAGSAELRTTSRVRKRPSRSERTRPFAQFSGRPTPASHTRRPSSPNTGHACSQGCFQSSSSERYDQYEYYLVMNEIQSTVDFGVKLSGVLTPSLQIRSASIFWLSVAFTKLALDFPGHVILILISARYSSRTKVADTRFP